ncbi:MAG: GntR family transcriptional regulator [Kiritimatiellae bacterium]|nr:GntR family transcriptional regulator [Kiritimatiellia bacterium]
MNKRPLKYKVVFAELQEQIRRGKFDESHPFPSETQIMRRFNVGRQTAIRVFQELQKSGLVVRKQGAGTFLTPAARHTGRIGLIIHGSSYCEIFAPISRTISHLCQQKGYTLLLGDIAFPTPKKRAEQVLRLVRDYIRQGIDGVLIQPLELLKDAEAINRKIMAMFDAAHTPAVLLDSDILPSPNRSHYDLVGINHFDAGRSMANHLRDVGAKRICYLMQGDRAPCVSNRWLGLKTGCEGLPLAGKQLLSEPDDRKTIGNFLKKNKPDAIACYNDRQAAILIQTLAQLGKKVPEDLLVAGFDDVNFAKLVTPQLTTTHQPCEEIAQTAFDMLLQRIGNPALPPREVFLSAPLVIRDSTVVTTSPAPTGKRRVYQ